MTSRRSITAPALRIKLTGVCNRTCSFCHEEGDMKTIGAVEPTDAFFGCVHSLLARLGINRVMLTGGEPTILPQFNRIIAGIDCEDKSVTTNGIRPISEQEWAEHKVAGLRKVVVSIHDADPATFVGLELKPRTLSWGRRSLDGQLQNVAAASRAGLDVRVNTVVYDSASQVLDVLKFLEELQLEHGFEIRLLNDLANTERSQASIMEVCTILGAREVGASRRAGSSNAVGTYETDSGFRFTMKMAYPYFFASVCDGCPIKAAGQCFEGFYGVRLERRGADYWVRLCIYKQSRDVLMPWREFLDSSLSEEVAALCATEQLATAFVR